MRIAILTGASSGLGREYARQITAQNHDIDEVWAIARRKERLDELAAQLPCPVRVLPLDLSKTASLDALKKLLEIERPVVRWLVCAAGFGKISDIADLDPQDALDMVNVNCRAAMGVTNLCLPYLTKGSRILEICSTASFQPLPGLGVYAATKAFLYSYTKTLHHELLFRGVHVTAVCPYWVKDTEFIPVARAGKAKQYRHFPLASKKETVVRLALSDSRLGLPVSTPGPVSFFHRIAAKFIPSEIMMGIWALLRRI